MSGASPNATKKELDFDDVELLPLASKLKKPLKKEPKQEAVDEERISLASLKKNKKVPNGDTSNATKENSKAGRIKVEGSKASRVKKEEPEEEDFEREDKPLIKKKIKEEPVKKKVTGGKSAEVTVAKKERKVYSLPGQRLEPPDERDPLRVFYETLHQQVPTSEMAAIWMMERGLLPEKEAAIIYAKKLKNRQQSIKSPVKVVSAAKTVKVSAKKPKEVPKESPEKPKSKVTKKRKACDDSSDGDDDDDFVMPHKKLRR